MSIGNRVFLDNGAGKPRFLDNGIMDADELADSKRARRTLPR